MGTSFKQSRAFPHGKRSLRSSLTRSSFCSSSPCLSRLRCGYEGASGLPYESLAILAIVLLNAVIGYVQQARAEEAVAALRGMTAAQATVLRDGERRSVPAVELVPGDIILIEEGDTIPADARLIQSVALQTAEAALTGESLPVAKDIAAISQEVALGDRHNTVFSGTIATYGRGRAVVTATGMRTAMGRIAGMLHGAESETRLCSRNSTGLASSWGSWWSGLQS